MRPKVTVNCACSADGKLASRLRRQVSISGPEDMARVHLLRAGSDAVLVGVGTVLADDPKLTVKEKYAPGGGEPARVVLDPRARTPPDAKVLGPGGPTYVAVLEMVEDPERFSRLNALREAGAEILFCCDAPSETEEPRLDLVGLLEQLDDRGVKELMVEGGGETIWHFMREGLVDELHIFHGCSVIGGRDAPTPVDGQGFAEPGEFLQLELVSVERMDDGFLASYRRKP